MFSVAPMSGMRRKVPKRASARSISIPAPTGGWNARDGLGDMPQTDAVTLDNWFPGTTDLQARKGATSHATGLTTQVQTLMAYAGGATEKFFAVNAGGSIFDVTAAGAVGAAAVTGLSNGIFHYINVTTAGGSYLAAVNGANYTQYFTGSAWAKDTDGAPYNVTGFDTRTAQTIHMHKGRIWYAKKNTLKLYYLDIGSLGGTATEFDLSSVAMLGGRIVQVATWTIDAGYGVDDLFVVATDQGEIIVYRGTDPSSAATWALVGIWQLGSPVGDRCLRKWQGDLLYIGNDGLFPMSAGLQSSRVDSRAALTDKIQNAISAATMSYGSNYGWQVQEYPAANMLILNVPVSVGTQVQYVMNLITKAWCRFTGWAANCFELFQDNLYFGGNGIVYKAWSTNADDALAINTDALQAYSYFGAPGYLKHCKMVRPNLNVSGPPSIYANVSVDFATTDLSTVAAASASASAKWDSATWDSGLWGSELEPYRQWFGSTGLGFAMAPRLKTQTNGIEVRWISTDVVIERGGVL